jgi:ketosteroid isomerase-like protein
MDVDRAFAARALAAGVPAAFGEFAAPDGAMLSGQPGIVYGPDAIRSTLAANFPANGQILWHPVQGHAAASGDLGFTVGESESHTFFPDGAPRVTYSKYLTVWHRLDRGTWRFEMDGGNARPAS